LGDMPEIVSECPLCASTRSRVFDQRRFHDLEVVNRFCMNCGLVYQSPRMTAEESAAFYAEEYRLLQEGSRDPTLRNMNAQKERARLMLEFIRPTIPAVSRHLDIGCSLGILLQQIKSSYQDQAVGVEPGEAHRQYAVKEGLTVFPSLNDLASNGQARFDLISLSHVLEHLYNPVGYLTHLREALMTPQGWLLLEVPNLYAHDSFEVAHLYAFSPHTLREILSRSGFEIVRFKKHGRPNSAILPLYLTVLCRPASQVDLQPIRPEHFVALKRQTGFLWGRVLGKLLPARAWLNV
jgi:SAM-dependent methyltransferase